MALSSIIASDIVPLKKRGLIQGIVNIFYGLGSGIGAPLGGFIVSRSNWRSAFLIQVPFLLLAWVLVFIFVRYKLPTQVDNKAKAMKQVDWLGSATLVVCISGLLLGLSWKNNEGYEWKNVRVWGSALAFLLGLAAFIGVEAKVAANPVMPLRILSHRSPICKPRRDPHKCTSKLTVYVTIKVSRSRTSSSRCSTFPFCTTILSSSRACSSFRLRRLDIISFPSPSLYRLALWVLATSYVTFRVKTALPTRSTC